MNTATTPSAQTFASSLLKANAAVHTIDATMQIDGETKGNNIQAIGSDCCTSSHTPNPPPDRD